MSMKPEEKKLREELIGAEDTATFQQNCLVEAGSGCGQDLYNGAPHCKSPCFRRLRTGKSGRYHLYQKGDRGDARSSGQQTGGIARLREKRERDESGTKLSVDEKDRRVRRFDAFGPQRGKNADQHDP